jgi:hypothetical protein
MRMPNKITVEYDIKADTIFMSPCTRFIAFRILAEIFELVLINAHLDTSKISITHARRGRHATPAVVGPVVGPVGSTRGTR